MKKIASFLRRIMQGHFLFYNGERLRTPLGDRTPYEVYFKKPILLNTGQASQTMHQMQPSFSS